MEMIQFTKDLASSDPTPGGGGASALVASLAASLAEMVTNLTKGKKKYAEYENEINEICNKLDLLRQEFYDCIALDAKCFLPLANAYKMDKNDPNYDSIMENCLCEAIYVPCKMIDLLINVIEYDERLMTIGSRLAISDVATSAILAYSAFYGSLINIKINTKYMKNNDYKNQINNEYTKKVNDYATKAMSIYQQINKELG